ITRINRWFIQQMKELVEEEENILKYKGKTLPDDVLKQAKLDGFADKYLSKILCVPEKEIRAKRTVLGIEEAWEPIPVSGVKDGAYYFSTYNAVDHTTVSPNKKIMVLGGGPNRIGQGIEFDYCCVHAAFAIRDNGYESIMVNCNPETVSTDYDTSNKLYFEPLTAEDVISIYNKEKPIGVIVQFGGQTPLNLAKELVEAGVKILGTTPETIDLAEDRDRFRHVINKLGIPQPKSGMAGNIEEALSIANEIGYPLMIRPSYVLGGRAMKILQNEEMLREYVAKAVGVSPDRPLLLDRFLQNAIETEADAISDGKDAFVPTIMQHIEYAGIHSGDSACVIPPVLLTKEHKKTINEYTKKLAIELGVVGLLNIQYAICDDVVYILEANPRASRTVPLVSKVCAISMARVATEIMLGKPLAEFNLKNGHIPHFGVKEAVFPFNMFPSIDPLLGPEMRSTGEVLGLADSFEMAFFKSQDAAISALPLSGNVLITVANHDKENILPAAKNFAELGFNIYSTGGTRRFLEEHGIKAKFIQKIQEGRPNIVDAIKNGEIQLVVNTPSGLESETDDSYIRKNAIKYRVSYITTPSAAYAATLGIKARQKGEYHVKALQEYHKVMKEQGLGRD
ncbi:MAG: carbamoyl-phosphate synthase large subunit, partial [Bacteroidales bacterium]|nr:carbamoyl-phosphate synthase large subunit [Bacteroidales bacterium]